MGRAEIGSEAAAAAVGDLEPDSDPEFALLPVKEASTPNWFQLALRGEISAEWPHLHQWQQQQESSASGWRRTLTSAAPPVWQEVRTPARSPQPRSPSGWTPRGCPRALQPATQSRQSVVCINWNMVCINWNMALNSQIGGAPW